MSVDDKILRRIQGKTLGWVFTPSHFLDLGSYGSVVLALKQICDRGRIRRLARGLYENPKTHSKLGKLTPSAEQIVEAISTKEGGKRIKCESISTLFLIRLSPHPNNPLYRNLRLSRLKWKSFSRSRIIQQVCKDG